MSTLKVFSIFQNCKMLIEKNKSTNLDGLVNTISYNRQNVYIKNKCSELYRFINNGFFTFDDLKIYFLNHYIFNEKLNWKDVKTSEVLTNKKIYTEESLKKDKVFILTLNKKLKLKDINIYYKVNTDGNNILYDLLLKRYVSPMFYIRMYKYIENKDEKYIPSDSLKRVDLVTKEIKKIMEVSNPNNTKEKEQ
jgi:hypothetical protein